MILINLYESKHLCNVMEHNDIYITIITYLTVFYFRNTASSFSYLIRSLNVVL